MKKVYGVLGKKLSHSFSRKYFEKKFSELGLNDHSYENFEYDSVCDFIKVLKERKEICGFNVTNPYKAEIIPFLDEGNEEVKNTNAVNCVKNIDGKLFGYNTDVYGFSQSIKPFLDHTHSRALVLGSGGAARAVASVLKRVGVEVYFVTTSKIKNQANFFFYSELNEIIFKSFKLIVNATPLGMFPSVDTYPNIPYSYISSDHLCYDLIYNPQETVFLRNCREQGATGINGLSMLHLQADKSWEVWNNLI